MITLGLAMSLLRLLLPYRCAACGRRPAGPSGCCAPCLAELFAPLRLPGMAALGYYRSLLRAAIRAYKYRGVRILARLFGTELAVEADQRGWRPGVIAHVPLHRSRLHRRGFDQAELIADVLAAELGVPHHRLLRRRHATSQQARLGAGSRRGNVASAFEAALPAAGRAVLLVDDVLTTAATVTACRTVLHGAGAALVLVAVVAVAPPPARESDSSCGYPGGSQKLTRAPVVIPSTAPTSTCG